MDPFSTAASGIAVVSLALQLVQSVDNISKCIRNVKDAPKELIRLNGRLERLGALLKDAHQLVKLRAAMPKHLGLPSATLSDCLQSCEESLLPLKTKVTEYTRSQTRNKCAAVRLSGNIWLSFKMKDIANLEARIRDEIASLTSAVAIASAILQVSIIPYGRVRSSDSELSKKQVMIPAQDDTVSLRSRSPITRVYQKQVNVPFMYRLLGVSKQSFTNHLSGDDNAPTDHGEPLSEEIEYLWNVRLLGRALRWKQTTLYGNLATSFSTYPIVKQFPTSVDKVLKNGTLQDFRGLLSSGKLHPFTRDEHGASLLHMAASYRRLDVCRTLSACGLQPDFVQKSGGFSPFFYATNYLQPSGYFQLSRTEVSVDILRYFLLELPHLDDFENHAWDKTLLVNMDVETTEWMWRFSVTELTGSEKVRLQRVLFDQLVWLLSRNLFLEKAFLIMETVAATLDDELLEEISRGQAGLLAEFMSTDCPSEGSGSVGATYIGFLKRLGLDYVEAISKELETFDSGVVKSRYGKRKVSFGYEEEQGWTLQWEHHFDDESPSLELMSEFTSMTANMQGSWQWPFFDIDWTAGDLFRENTKWDARRNRRILNQSRKETARSGHKRIRSRMPGAWSS